MIQQTIDINFKTSEIKIRFLTYLDSNKFTFIFFFSKPSSLNRTSNVKMLSNGEIRQYIILTWIFTFLESIAFSIA